MTIPEVVAGRGNLAGVRWLLFGAETERMIRQTLSGLLRNSEVLGPWRLCGVRFKPEERLTAVYEVGIPGRGSRPVAATWKYRLGGGWQKKRAQIEAIHSEASKRGLLAPFRALAAEVGEWNLRVQVAPFDIDFPQLVRVTDPAYLVKRFPQLSPGNGTKPPVCTAPSIEPKFLRYQPGKRPVLRYKPANSTSKPTFFAKLASADRSARAFRMSVIGRDWFASHSSTATCVGPLAYAPDDAVVLYPEVAGLPLSRHLRRPSQDLKTWLSWAGEGLNLLHSTPKALAEGLEEDFFREKIAPVCKFVRTLLPKTQTKIDALLEGAQQLYPHLPQEPPTFMHSDFKIEHLFLTKDSLTLIDLDDCRLGDPAVDVGTFLADLRVRHSCYGLAGVEEAQKHFLDGYSLGVPRERLLRARFFEALELVHLTAWLVPLADPLWASRTENSMHLAGVLMDRLRNTLGV